jgi:phasin family protein
VCGLHDQEPTMDTQTTQAGSANPFAQAMDQAKGSAQQFARLFSELKLPAGPDTELLLSALKRNMETLSAVNHVALEGAQAVARRHMEIMQQTMSELTETMRSLAALTDTPQARAGKQTELLKKSYERAIANTREISDLIQRSGTEASELLNHRFAEALDEVKSLVGKSAGTQA